MNGGERTACDCSLPSGDRSFYADRSYATRVLRVDVIRGREEVLEQQVPALDTRTPAVELFTPLPRCIPVLDYRALLGSEHGTVELYQEPAVAQEHLRALNRERRRPALGLVESVEAGRGGVGVVVTVREDRDVLCTLLRREKREEDADRHLLSREPQALIGKRISVCGHQQVDEDDIEESFREVPFTTKDRLSLAVAVGGYQAVLPIELPPGGVLVDGVVVNDEDFHDCLLSKEHDLPQTHSEFEQSSIAWLIAFVNRFAHYFN